MHLSVDPLAELDGLDIIVGFKERIVQLPDGHEDQGLKCGGDLADPPKPHLEP